MIGTGGEPAPLGTCRQQSIPGKGTVRLPELGRDATCHICAYYLHRKVHKSQAIELVPHSAKQWPCCGI